ncbi:MAG: hypothetical protein JWP92_266 [Caulobacter sp.]|nr:hypothetical protein [Caulobacter sp.]
MGAARDGSRRLAGRIEKDRGEMDHGRYRNSTETDDGAPAMS